MTYMSNDDLMVARSLHAKALAELDRYQGIMDADYFDAPFDGPSADRALCAATAYSLAAQTAIQLGSPK